MALVLRYHTHKTEAFKSDRFLEGLEARVKIEHTDFGNPTKQIGLITKSETCHRRSAEQWEMRPLKERETRILHERPKAEGGQGGVYNHPQQENGVHFGLTGIENKMLWLAYCSIGILLVRLKLSPKSDNALTISSFNSGI
jgi:hypothetical protein